MKLMKHNSFSEVGPLTWVLEGAPSTNHFDGGPSCPFAPDAVGELNVFGHYCNTLSMYCAQVCVFEKTDHVRYHADTPITIKAEASSKANSRPN